jgi:beta-lactamase superfamily II metal-dependent hydrolase
MNQTTHPGPNPQEIEVSFFGPGFGESVVIHAGNDEWIVIDSCIDSDSGQPAALVYFNQIGVDPSKAVRLVLATHWHDDHIGGMAELVGQCAAAEFACSAAVTRNEFLEVAAVYNSRPLSRELSGVSEIYRTLLMIRESGRVPKYAIADRPLFRSARGNCEVTALSPTDGEMVRFLRSVTALLPTAQPAVSNGDTPGSPAKTKVRFPWLHENDSSVASWVAIGEIQLLLGADLEEHHQSGRGWTAVLASSTRPAGVACLFKIAHYGSGTGHHDQVWSQMPIPSPCR